MTSLAGRAVLITGTDTGIGKSAVGAAIAAAWTGAGRRVGVYKPVESGVDGEPADGSLLRRAAGELQPLDEVCPVRLAAPLAPPLAAAAEGVSLDPEVWRRRIASLRRRFDLVLVEGAGGLLSPLWEGGDAATLALRCGLPLIVVAPDRLGVINHARLVLEVCERRGIEVLAVVLDRVEAGGDPSRASNRDQVVAAAAGVPVVGPLAHVDPPEPEGLAEALRAAPGADALLPT